MGRRRRNHNPHLHGLLVVDKPLGLSSMDVVRRVRRAAGGAKTGHAGTLDPLATGVLPVALGEATKTVAYVMDGRKRYRFTVRWGEARDTDDSEGAVTETSDARPDRDAIVAALGDFVGLIRQTPPAFSAIKIDGRRAYALARAGEAFAVEPREVQIDSFELIALQDRDHAVFDVHCGKGTYMRALARDLARRLGTVGHIAALRRTAAGPFDEAAAISLESLESLVHSAPPSAYLRAVETALDDIPALALNAAQADHLRHGRPVRVQGPEGRLFVDTSRLDEGDGLCAMAECRPVALARLERGEIRAVWVLDV